MSNKCLLTNTRYSEDPTSYLNWNLLNALVIGRSTGLETVLGKGNLGIALLGFLPSGKELAMGLILVGNTPVDFQ